MDRGDETLARRRQTGHLMESFTVVGTRFNACTYGSAVERMEAWIDGGRTSHYVCVSNVYDVMLARRSAEVREALAEADMVVPDGTPIVWGGRLLGTAVPMRVYGPTLMWTALKVSSVCDRKHFLYGGTAELLGTLSARLREAFPGLRIVGTMPHPFRDLTLAEETETLATINGSGADYLWVGIGTERQLVWMHRYRSRLEVPVVVGVGAAFAFHAGLVRQAPRFVQDLGLEWLFRLVVEPRRLWRRYLIVNPPFLVHFTRQYLDVKFGRRDWGISVVKKERPGPKGRGKGR